MKNLFKNLMLVAVAAMAFTACSEDNNEVNEVAKKTVISGVLSFDEDTRSGFVGTETTDNGDGTTTTVYKSAWEGGETIKLFANGLETTATVDTAGKFTAMFDGELPESFYMTVCSPADAWNSQSQPTIANVQTPRANSVDPVAHILQVQNVYVTNGSADAAKMEHQAAYGKMTVNAPEGFVIDNVVVNLKGTYYMDYERECNYTINADNVQNNVFWFTTETFENVTEFTVTAYDAEGKAVTKTVDVAAADKTLAFKYGRVSTFSVSGLEAYAAPTFTSAKWTNTATYDKLIQFYSDELGTLQLNFYNCNTDNWIDARTYGFAQTGEIYPGGSYSWWQPVSGEKVYVTNGQVVVTVVDGKYHFEFIGLTDNYNSYSLTSSFTGTIENLEVPDTRAKLATPEPSYEVNGMSITISWEPVEGAVGYSVQEYYDSVNTTTTETSITVEVTEYRTYYFYISALAADNDPNYKNSDEAYFNVEFEDPRPILSNPANVTATVDGIYATISWDLVEGADYYQLYYYLNGQQYIDVKEGTSYTLELGYGLKDLYVYVFSKANEDNPYYRSSDDWNAYVLVNTDKDPNVIAQYMWDETFVWDAAGYFLLTDSTYGSSSYWRIFLNAADRPGNNSIKEGVYYGENNTASPAAGKFCTRMGAASTAPFSSFYQSYVQSSWTLEVKIVDGQYQIVLDAGSYGTYGYKGMPDGFVLPSEGGSDEGGSDEGDGDGAIQMTKLYYRESAMNVHNYVMENADGSCKLTITLNNQDATTTWIPQYTYTSSNLSGVNGNSGYFSLQYDTAKINGTSYNMNASGHTLKVTSSSNGGNHEIELTAVTSSGDEYKFVYSGVITTF